MATASLKHLCWLLPIYAVLPATASLFQYEKEHLTESNINDALDQKLPKQSRLRSAEAHANYLDTFRFSTYDVTSEREHAIGALNSTRDCKVFPGNASWPSQWLWTGLELATGGDLSHASPMAHICYANGTGSADEAACATLTEDWNVARIM